MKTDLFIKYVENSRDCEEALLDIAIKKGMRRAKDYAFDYKKLVSLAAAIVVTAVLCLAAKMEPIKTAASTFVNVSDLTTESGSIILHGYITDIVNTIMRYLGGL